MKPPTAEFLPQALPLPESKDGEKEVVFTLSLVNTGHVLGTESDTRDRKVTGDC